MAHLLTRAPGDRGAAELDGGGGANITFGWQRASTPGSACWRADQPTEKGAGGLRWMTTTTPTMIRLVRRGGGGGGRQRVRRSAQKSRLKIRGIQICVVVRGGGAAGAPLDRWLSVVRLRCGRRCRTGNSMVMASSLRGASVRACVRACARAFELVAHSMCPASSPVATSSLPPSASAPMPWLMMAIVEAAGHSTTAPTRRDSRRRDGQAKNHTMETDTALGLSLSSHPLFLKSRQRLCICDGLRVEPLVSRQRSIQVSK